MIQEFFLIVIGILFSGIALVAGTSAYYSSRRLRRYFGLPLFAVGDDGPPASLIDQPCDFRYRQTEGRPEAVLRVGQDADAAFTQADLAAIQSHVGATGYEIVAPDAGYRLEIRFDLTERRSDETEPAADERAADERAAGVRTAADGGDAPDAADRL